MHYSFQHSLDKARAVQDEKWLEQKYRDAFGSYKYSIVIEGEEEYLWAQMSGRDRTVLLSNGKALHIEEKLRYRDHGDLALEYISVGDDGRTRLGWMEKDLGVDFLAYVFVPSQRLYLLPWHDLRRAWLKNRTEWTCKAHNGVDGFTKISARNCSYTTYCCCVPIDTLLDGLRGGLLL